MNKTRVIPARLFGKKDTGGNIEILLLNQIDETRWEILVGGKKMEIDRELFFDDQLTARITKNLGSSKREITFSLPVNDKLESMGNIPLPPYIHEELADPERYQTVYAEAAGSAAAPTAGLHFTSELLDKLKTKGIAIEEITLHVGLDTFAPVIESEVEEHVIHSEWCEVTEKVAEKINAAIDIGGRVIAVGTTTVRTLESAACKNKIHPFQGQTNLFIYPGYKFKIVDGLITNFHLPKSSLLMLVSAFADRKNIINCYKEAIQKEYRFYSFGDAMLIL